MEYEFKIFPRATSSLGCIAPTAPGTFSESLLGLQSWRMDVFQVTTNFHTKVTKYEMFNNSGDNYHIQLRNISKKRSIVVVTKSQ